MSSLDYRFYSDLPIGSLVFRSAAFEVLLVLAASDTDMERQHQNEHMHNPNHDHGHEHADDEHSPESAGLARGLARSAASRSAVGRLPVSSSARAGKSAVRTAATARNLRIRPRATMPKPTSVAGKIKMRGGGGGAKTSTAASKAKVRTSAGNVATKSAGSANRAAAKVATPRGAGRGVNVRRIARASDRASTGLDLVEAASSEDTVEGTKETNGGNRDVGNRVKDILRRVPAFMTTLAKNTVLGMAVFATYEGVVEYDLLSSSFSSDPRKGERSDMIHSDPFAEASLYRHVGAGFLAGTAHAGVNYTMEGIAQTGRTMFSGVTKTAATAPSPFLPYMMHHAISHSVLFGSYEGTKRLLMATLGAQRDNNNDRDDHHENDFSNLCAIGLAGGIAGIAQHVVSEYTEGVLVASYSKIWRKNLTLTQRLNLLPRASLPSARVLAMAFIPSSIGFVAFEYGKEFMSDDE